MARFFLDGGRGWLTVSEERGRAVCRGQLPDDKKGLYKGWLTGPAGRALLGTFVPEQGVLVLSRTLSVAELERQGAWPPGGGEAVLAYAFQREPRNRPVPPRALLYINSVIRRKRRGAHAKETRG